MFVWRMTRLLDNIKGFMWRDLLSAEKLDFILSVLPLKKEEKVIFLKLIPENEFSEASQGGIWVGKLLN